MYHGILEHKILNSLRVHRSLAMRELVDLHLFDARGDETLVIDAVVGLLSLGKLYADKDGRISPASVEAEEI